MSKKTNKIYISAMDEIIKQNYVNEEVVEWYGQELHIQKSLDMDDMLSFVDSVYRSCFDKETNEYRPEAKDFAIRVNVMDRYANIAIPSNVDHQYQIAICSGVVETIMEHINRAQFNEMMKAIDAKISNTAAANVSALIMQFDNVVDQFNVMQDNMAKLFSGVTSDDIQKIAAAIAENGMPTEEGIVKAYISQTTGDAQGDA